MSEDNKLHTIGRNTYRAGMGLSVGAILWLQGQFVSKESFADYRQTHQTWAGTVMDGYNLRFDRLDQDIARLEKKVDRLPGIRRAEWQPDGVSNIVQNIPVVRGPG
jgi:hypothetical protein